MQLIHFNISGCCSYYSWGELVSPFGLISNEATLKCENQQRVKSVNHFTDVCSIIRRLSFWLTGIILLGGTVLTLFTEWNNPNTIGNLSFFDKVLVSFFQTVTMRTAGFATIDYTTAHPTSLLLYCIQMLIGGSPGGTAGGVKTTTFLVVLLFIRSEVYDEKMIQFRNHSISQEMARKALTIFIVFTTLILRVCSYSA